MSVSFLGERLQAMVSRLAYQGRAIPLMCWRVYHLLLTVRIGAGYNAI